MISVWKSFDKVDSLLNGTTSLTANSETPDIKPEKEDDEYDNSSYTFTKETDFIFLSSQVGSYFCKCLFMLCVDYNLCLIFDRVNY